MNWNWSTFITGLIIGIALTSWFMEPEVRLVEKSSSEEVYRPYVSEAESEEPQEIETHAASKPALAKATLVVEEAAEPILAKEKTVEVNKPTDPVLSDSQVKEYVKDSQRSLLEKVQEVFPRGRVTYDKTFEDGYRSLIEQTENGATVTKSFDEYGQVIGERLKKPGGIEISRSYDTNGNLVGFFYKTGKKKSVSLSWDSSGQLASRRDRFNNDQRIYTYYNEYGYPSEYWRRTKDGRRLKIE